MSPGCSSLGISARIGEVRIAGLKANAKLQLRGRPHIGRLDRRGIKPKVRCFHCDLTRLIYSPVDLGVFYVSLNATRSLQILVLPDCFLFNSASTGPTSGAFKDQYTIDWMARWLCCPTLTS
jgi:hypothetical protein